MDKICFPKRIRAFGGDRRSKSFRDYVRVEVRDEVRGTYRAPFRKLFVGCSGNLFGIVSSHSRSHTPGTLANGSPPISPGPCVVLPSTFSIHVFVGFGFRLGPLPSFPYSLTPSFPTHSSPFFFVLSFPPLPSRRCCPGARPVSFSMVSV